MQTTEISVLMSLYKKEKPEYLSECLASILSQTLLPKEIVIVVDGPITPDLSEVLAVYQSKSGLLRLLPQKENKGLGYTLAVGVTACRCELIARMDTDDLMLPSRLETQASCFNKIKSYQSVARTSKSLLMNLLMLLVDAWYLNTTTLSGTFLRNGILLITCLLCLNVRLFCGWGITSLCKALRITIYGRGC